MTLERERGRNCEARQKDLFPGKTAFFQQISVPEQINCGLLLEAKIEAEAEASVRPKTSKEAA